MDLPSSSTEQKTPQTKVKIEPKKEPSLIEPESDTPTKKQKLSSNKVIENDGGEQDEAGDSTIPPRNDDPDDEDGGPDIKLSDDEKKDASSGPTAQETSQVHAVKSQKESKDTSKKERKSNPASGVKKPRPEEDKPSIPLPLLSNITGFEEDDDLLDLQTLRELEHEEVSKFTESQMKRYEQYRRSDLKKEKVKKILVTLNPAIGTLPAGDPYIIAVKGLGKVFVGDLVEIGREVMQERGDTGPLQPKHIREAYRRLNRDGLLPSVNKKPDLFSL